MANRPSKPQPKAAPAKASPPAAGGKGKTAQPSGKKGPAPSPKR